MLGDFGAVIVALENIKLVCLCRETNDVLISSPVTVPAELLP